MPAKRASAQEITRGRPFPSAHASASFLALAPITFAAAPSPSDPRASPRTDRPVSEDRSFTGVEPTRWSLALKNERKRAFFSKGTHDYWFRPAISFMACLGHDCLQNGHLSPPSQKSGSFHFLSSDQRRWFVEHFVSWLAWKPCLLIYGEHAPSTSSVLVNGNLAQTDHGRAERPQISEPGREHVIDLSVVDCPIHVDRQITETRHLLQTGGKIRRDEPTCSSALKQSAYSSGT